MTKNTPTRNTTDEGEICPHCGSVLDVARILAADDGVLSRAERPTKTLERIGPARRHSDEQRVA